MVLQGPKSRDFLAQEPTYWHHVPEEKFSMLPLFAINLFQLLEPEKKPQGQTIPSSSSFPISLLPSHLLQKKWMERLKGPSFKKYQE